LLEEKAKWDEKAMWARHGRDHEDKEGWAAAHEPVFVEPLIERMPEEHRLAGLWQRMEDFKLRALAKQFEIQV